MSRSRLTGWILALGLSLPQAQAQEGTRHALVIGTDRYDGLSQQLQVAVRDARLMEAALRRVDPAFQVHIVENGTRQEVDDALDAFVKAAQGAECALVYFAGHGVEFQGDNFLLTRDTKLATLSADVNRAKRQMGNVAVSLQTIVDDLESTGANLTVVILDACRDNPLEVEMVASDGGRTRSAVGKAAGLGQVSAPSGMLVAYAADAGQQANDGLFTPVLCKHLVKPGLDIVRVFAETREEVSTNSRQMEKDGTGVFHEPADYSKLNPAGTRFVFSRSAPMVGADGAAELERMLAENERLKKELAMPRPPAPAIPAVVEPLKVPAARVKPPQPRNWTRTATPGIYACPVDGRTVNGGGLQGETLPCPGCRGKFLIPD